MRFEDLAPADLPEYISHKRVHALRISGFIEGKPVVVTPDGVSRIVEVPAVVFHRSTPKVGDYLVRYSDGYISYSPREQFETGYTKRDNFPAECCLRALLP